MSYETRVGVFAETILRDTLLRLASQLSEASEPGKKMAVILIVAVGLFEINKLDELYNFCVRIAEREVAASEN